MSIAPFSRPGRFWRGNLHCHSTLSDGLLTPDAVCDFYREHGYDFIALTDHFLPEYNYPIADTRPYRRDGFTTLIGAELHSGKTRAGQMWELLAVGLPFDFAPPAADESGPMLAARAKAKGAFVAAAHPQFHTLMPDDLLGTDAIDALEVYNGTVIDFNDRAEGWHLFEMMLALGKRYTAIAADDAHFEPSRADTLRAWVQVRCETLMPDHLLEALKQGNFYASSGPEIDDIALLAGDKVRVCCSPAERIFLTGAGWQAVQAYGQDIREVELSLRGFDSPYGRITVRDRHGQRAWSNPFWL